MNRCGTLWPAWVVLTALSSAIVAPPAAAQQPWNLTRVWQLPGRFDAVTVAGHYAYITGNTWTSPLMLGIFDVSDPDSPVESGSFVLAHDGPGVQVSAGLAYLANSVSGLKIVDVTNPSSPTLRGSYPTQWETEGVFISGGLAYMADGEAGLRIVDVTNPTSPTLRGRYQTPDRAADVFVSDGLAYVADRSSLQIVDVTNPSSPTLRGCYWDPLGGRIWDVFVSGQVAYVTATTGDYWTGYYARFLSLDMTSPAAPRLVASYGTPGAGAGLYVTGGFAYAILGDGLRILDVSLPWMATLRGFYPLDPSGGVLEGWGRVFVNRDLVYVAPVYGGPFMILRYTPPQSQATRWNLYR